MMWRLISTVCVALTVGSSPFVQAEDLCSIAPGSYAAAKVAYPDAAFAIAELENYGIATWYTDRDSNYASVAQQLVSTCSEDSRIVVVVYGLPNKDCAGGYSSSGGSVQSASDYAQFIQTLADTMGQRKVLYILEPDAVGLIADGGCGVQNNYLSNLQTAIGILANNPNAQVYADVGYWTLESSSDASEVASVVAQLATFGCVKGITLNTSNYRSNSELSTLCSNFQNAIGSSSLNCIVDTARNYNGAPSSNEWCNVKSAGIGRTPTSETGISNIDYFVWIKPPGESDGTCDGSDRSSDALAGPSAGTFFDAHFKLLWNQGYFVSENGWPVIDGTIRDYTTAPAATTATPTPTTATPTTGSTTSSYIQEDRSYEATASSYETTSTSTNSSTVSSAAGSQKDATDQVANEADLSGAWDYNENDAGTVSAGNTDTTKTDLVTTPAPTSSKSSGTEISTQSEGGSSISAGFIVMMALVGAAVVALVAIVGIRRRQQKLLTDAKTPTDAYPSYVMTTSSHHVSVL